MTARLTRFAARLSSPVVSGCAVECAHRCGLLVTVILVLVSQDFLMRRPSPPRCVTSRLPSAVGGFCCLVPRA